RLPAFSVLCGAVHVSLPPARTPPPPFPYPTLFRSPHRREHLGREDAGGLARGRQHGDDEVAFGDEVAQLLGPGIDALDAFRRHRDRKSTRLNSSHVKISYAVFCLKKKNQYPATNPH